MYLLPHVQYEVWSHGRQFLLLRHFKIPNVLEHFGLYKFAHHVSTDSALTAMVFHCSEVDW